MPVKIECVLTDLYLTFGALSWFCGLIILDSRLAVSFLLGCLAVLSGGLLVIKIKNRSTPKDILFLVSCTNVQIFYSSDPKP